MPIFGPPNIEKMKSKKDIKGLFKLMTAEKGDQSTQAGRALIASGAQTVAPLLDLVKKKEAQDKERNLAVGLIKAIGAPAVEPLLAALDGKEDSRRQVALQALGAIADPRSGEPILALLKRNQDVSFTSTLIAVNIAAKIMGTHAQDAILAYLLGGSSTFVTVKAHVVVKALGEIGDARSVEVLADLTRRRFRDAPINTDPQTRGLAAEALGKVAGRLKDAPDQEKAEAALVAMLKDSNPGLRAYACLALGQIIGHHAAGPLIAVLKDSEPLVRSSAAFGLRGSMGPEKVEPLIAMLGDVDKSIRVSAVEGLGTGSDVRACGPLIERLKDPEAEVRDAAVKSLLFFTQEKQVLQHLIDCLQDVNPSVRGSAVMVLGTMEAVDPLIASLKDADCGVRTQAAVHLGSCKEPRVVNALIEGLKDPEWTMRYTCVSSLGKIGTPEATAGLNLGLADPDLKVRQAAAAALSKVESTLSEA